MSSLGLYGLLFLCFGGVLLVFHIIVKCLEPSTQKAVEANYAVKAKVLKVTADPNHTVLSTVLFELEDGNRVPLVVKDNTCLEGETGTLHYIPVTKTFYSFKRDN